MCTTAAPRTKQIAVLFRVASRYVGNLAPMPGIAATVQSSTVTVIPEQLP